MKKYIFLAAITVGLFLTGQVFAGHKTKPAFLSDIRSLAMGGAGVATARGSFSYIYNPALLAKEKFSLTTPGVQFEFGKNFFDIINYAEVNTENFKKLDKKTEGVTQAERDTILNQLRIDAAKLDNIWYKTSITPSFGVVVKNIGFSVYNISHLATKIDVGIIVPKIKIYALNDLVISCGYGYQYNENLALGIAAKIINRRESPEFKIQVEEATGFEDTFNEGFNKMQKGNTGFSMDLGALYKINDRVELAVVAQDLVGKVSGNTIRMNLKLGVNYQPHENFIFAADMEDFFNLDGDKLVNKIYLGGEYSMPLISYRLGFGQGYPAIGVGLNLWVVDLAYTYYTKELTDTPGLKGESYHVVGLKFGWW